MIPPCTHCAPALPITTCPTSIAIGVVDAAIPEVLVRFTDRATGRVTVVEADPSELPTVVAPTPFQFVPGNSVMVEVLSVLDDGPGAPLEFLPFGVDLQPMAYPVTCIVFTATKSFGPDGSLLSGARWLILES